MMINDGEACRWCNQTVIVFFIVRSLCFEASMRSLWNIVMALYKIDFSLTRWNYIILNVLAIVFVVTASNVN